MWCVVLDVTESTGAVKSLKLTQFALDHALNPAFFIRDDGSFFYVNEAACRTLGYSREELLSLSVPDITPDYPPGTWANRWREMRDGRHITFEGYHRTKDGRVFPVEVTANLLEHDGVAYNCAFARDISERKHAEESQTRLTAILEATPDLVAYASPNEDVIYVNKAGREMVGVGLDVDITGLKISDFHPAWAYEILTREGLPKAIRDGAWTGEAAFLHRDGHEIPVSMVILSHKTPDGDVKYLSTISRDITERKWAEEELRESERKLRQAAEEREQLSRDLHDGILNSLYAIGLGLETCPPALENYPNNGCPHVAQVNAVMREVRSFIAGIERFIETENLEAAINSMVASMTSAHSTHIDVRLDLDIVKTLAHTQAMELLYITREALSNSLKHAKASQGVVSLRGEGDRVILEVSDDGEGFDPHHLLGRGRGLNNITARARHLGGHLHVQSEPGQGTQIILDIPQ